MVANKEIVKSFDPGKNSLGNLMSVVFPQSRSVNYPLSIKIAKTSILYDETIIGNKLFHMAVFSTSKDDVKKALALLNYLIGLKGISVFMNGNPHQNPYSIYNILQCFFKSLHCDDYRAYCYTVIEDPFKESHIGSGRIGFSMNLFNDEPGNKITTIKRFVFPCKYLYSYFRFQKGHPSSINHQIQAAAVDYYSEWCPNFHPNEFKKLPTTIIWPDGKHLMMEED